MKRREFLKRGAVVIGAAVVGSNILKSNPAKAESLIGKAENLQPASFNGTEFFIQKGEGGYVLPCEYSDMLGKELRKTSPILALAKKSR